MGYSKIKHPKQEQISLKRLIFRRSGRCFSELISAVSAEPTVVPEYYVI